jgi:hypothetical protein
MKKISKFLLEIVQGNAKYTSLQIQKKILNILPTNVRNKICDKIGDAKFCIIVDGTLENLIRSKWLLF